MTALRLPAVLICALAAASPSAAHNAQAAAPIDLIATLDTVCVSAQGDRARTATLAAEAGYSPVPTGVLPRMRNTSEDAGFMRSNATDISFVMTGKMTRRLGRETLVMEFCGVTARPVDHRALDGRLRAAMGFPPVRGAGMEAYAWLQTPEGRAPSRTLTDPQVIAMAQTGQMRMIALDRAGRGSTLLYFLPRID